MAFVYSSCQNGPLLMVQNNALTKPTASSAKYNSISGPLFGWKIGCSTKQFVGGGP